MNKKMKLFKNRKGNVEIETMYAMIGLVILGVFLVFYAIMLGTFVKSNVHFSTETKIYPYYSRILMSPSCFVYQDSYSGKIYPGVWDIEKYTEENLKNCLNLQKRVGDEEVFNKISFSTQLIYEKEGKTEKNVLSTTNHKQTKFSKQYPVMVYEQGNFTNGYVIIGIGEIE